MSNYSDDGWGSSPVKSETNNGNVPDAYNYVEERKPRVVHEPIMQQSSPAQMTEPDIPCLQPPAKTWAAPAAEMPFHRHAPVATPKPAADYDVPPNEMEPHSVAPAVNSINQRDLDPSQFLLGRLLHAFSNLGKEFVQISKDFNDHYGIPRE